MVSCEWLTRNKRDSAASPAPYPLRLLCGAAEAMNFGGLHHSYGSRWVAVLAPFCDASCQDALSSYDEAVFCSCRRHDDATVAQKKEFIESNCLKERGVG